MTAQGSFEAKFYMLRKNKDGVIVGFVCHPSDVTPELLALDVGDIVNIEWSTDGEGQASTGSASERASTTAAQQSGEETAAPTKSHRKFSDMPLSTQAALRCGDVQFQHYLKVVNVEEAADFVPLHCGIISRSALDDPKNSSARFQWDTLERGFQKHLTTQMHGDLVR